MLASAVLQVLGATPACHSTNASCSLPGSSGSLLLQMGLVVLDQPEPVGRTKAALFSSYTLPTLCCRSTQEMEQGVEAVQHKVAMQQLRPENVTPAALEAHLYTQVPTICCFRCLATLTGDVERQQNHERLHGGQWPALSGVGSEVLALPEQMHCRGPLGPAHCLSPGHRMHLRGAALWVCCCCWHYVIRLPAEQHCRGCRRTWAICHLGPC